MIRRKIFFIVLFGIIFQLFFSTTNTLSINETRSSDEWTQNDQKNICEVASIKQFPSLFFLNEEHSILLYIGLILYSFAAIEIVCDDYFASALEKISYNLNLTPVRNSKLM